MAKPARRAAEAIDDIAAADAPAAHDETAVDQASLDGAGDGGIPNPAVAEPSLLQHLERATAFEVHAIHHRLGEIAAYLPAATDHTDGCLREFFERLRALIAVLKS